MAEKKAERQQPAGRFTWLWMVLSLVLVAGFLVWLGMESEPTQIQVVEEEEEEADTLVAVNVPLDSFVANVEQYAGAGEDVRLREIPVASLLGQQMFWTELPSEQAGLKVPYLVALHATIAADTTRRPEPGDTVTVVGQVQPVTDSVLNAWVSTGVLEESQRLEAEFASSFLEAKWLGGRPGARSGGGRSSSE